MKLAKTNNIFSKAVNSNTFFKGVIPQHSTVKFHRSIAICSRLDSWDVKKLFPSTFQNKIGGMHVTAESE